jgi:2-alkyl-3-oxoalkanoate reductase
MRILVTGATSLVGQHVVRALLERGDSVCVLQRRPSALEGVDEIRGDLRSSAAVTSAVRDVDAVVHAAAKVGIVGSWSEYESTNVVGTKRLIDAARAAGVSRFVYVSSPSVAHFGTSLVGAPAGPADPTRARGLYSRSKALGENLALASNDDRCSVVAIRPHLIWGPGDTQLIGRIVERARAGRMAAIGAGTSLIDTTFVDNAADALVAAVDRAPENGGRAFVVSNGEPRPVGELLNRIIEAAALPPISVRVPAPVARVGALAVESAWRAFNLRGEPPLTSFLVEQLTTSHWFDQRETRRALGWRPKVTLEEAFRRLDRSFAARDGSPPRVSTPSHRHT